MTRLILVWAALMGLLATTLALAYLPLGPLKPVTAYGIATIKAGLILWFFMELRREGELPRFAAAAGFAWIGVLLTLIAADYLSR